MTRDKRASEVRRGRGRPSSSIHTPTWTTRSRYLGAEDVSGSPRVRSQLPGKCLSDTAADTGRVQLTTHDPPQLGDRPQHDKVRGKYDNFGAGPEGACEPGVPAPLHQGAWASVLSLSTRLSHVRGTIHAHGAWRGEHRPAPPSQGFQSAPMTGVAQGRGFWLTAPCCRFLPQLGNFSCKHLNEAQKGVSDLECYNTTGRPQGRGQWTHVGREVRAEGPERAKHGLRKSFHTRHSGSQRIGAGSCALSSILRFPAMRF